MRYLKMLGLAVMAAAAAMAFIGAGTASATVLCENNQTTGCTSKHAVTSTESFSLVKGTLAELYTTGGITEDSCMGSTFVVNITNAGSSSATVVGSITAANLSWSTCTSTTVTLTGGELEIHSIFGSDNGTVTAKGFAVTVTTAFDCAYGAGTGIHLGTFTPNTSTGLGGTLAINTVVKRNNEHSNVFCPETAKWVANYTQTSTTAIKAVSAS